MSDIQSVFQTIATEGLRAVEAAAKAQEATVDDIRRQYREADADRKEGLLKVRKMREDAARMVAESIKIEEATEDAYAARLREIDPQFDALRTMRAGLIGRAA